MESSEDKIHSNDYKYGLALITLTCSNSYATMETVSDLAFGALDDELVSVL